MKVHLCTFIKVFGEYEKVERGVCTEALYQTLDEANSNGELLYGTLTFGTKACLKGGLAWKATRFGKTEPRMVGKNGKGVFWKGLEFVIREGAHELEGGTESKDKPPN